MKIGRGYKITEARRDQAALYWRRAKSRDTRLES